MPSAVEYADDTPMIVQTPKGPVRLPAFIATKLQSNPLPAAVAALPPVRPVGPAPGGDIYLSSMGPAVGATQPPPPVAPPLPGSPLSGVAGWIANGMLPGPVGLAAQGEAIDGRHR